MSGCQIATAVLALDGLFTHRLGAEGAFPVITEITTFDSHLFFVVSHNGGNEAHYWTEEGGHGHDSSVAVSAQGYEHY